MPVPSFAVKPRPVHVQVTLLLRPPTSVVEVALLPLRVVVVVRVLVPAALVRV